MRAVATRAANVIGDTLCFVLDFGDGWVVTINEEQPVWPMIIDALDHHPQCLVPSSEWKVRLMLAGPEEHIEVDLLNV